MRLPALAAALALAVSLSSCAEDEYLYVDKAWVRLPAVPGNPGAAYFTIHGGPDDETLLSVSSPIAIRTEIHESMSAGGTMSMKPVESVAVPAKSKVEFKPGGMHVMLFDLRRNVKAGDVVRLDFTFASGRQIYIEPRAQAAGDTQPAH